MESLMFAVFLSYKYYLMELTCCACLRIQSSLGILPHSLWLKVKCLLLKFAGLTQLSGLIPNPLDTVKPQSSLQNLAQSRDLLRQVFGRVNTRCRHHQRLMQDWLTVARDALTANINIGEQRRRLRIRDGPWTFESGEFFRHWRENAFFFSSSL